MMNEKKPNALNLDEMEQLAGGTGVAAVEPVVVVDDGPICRYPAETEFAHVAEKADIAASGLRPAGRTDEIPVVNVQVAPASN